MGFNTVPFNGKSAVIRKNNVTVAYGQDWSVNVTGDFADGSRQGQHWGEGLPGIYRLTGSMTLQVVLGNTQVKALIDNILTATPGVKLTDVKFTLQDTTMAFVCDIYITGFTTAPSVGGGIVTCGINFTSDSALSMSSSSSSSSG